MWTGGLLGFGRDLVPRVINAGRMGMAPSPLGSTRSRPQAAERWRELVGFYGWDHNTLEIRDQFRTGHSKSLRLNGSPPIRWRKSGKDTFCFPSWD